VIPTTTASVSPPVSYGNLTFHVAIDFTSQSFSMDGPETNGVRLHYEILKVARAQRNRFWEFDVRAESQQHASAEMQKHFPGHKFLGTWTDATKARHEQ